jgi:hypothetical protein
MRIDLEIKVKLKEVNLEYYYVCHNLIFEFFSKIDK